MMLCNECFKDEITRKLQKIHNSTFRIIMVPQIRIWCIIFVGSLFLLFAVWKATDKTMMSIG
jgi:hypothetical protein